jgi:hypothetical protein
MTFDHEGAYRRLKKGVSPYNEEEHCPLLMKIMANNERGTVSAFCVQAFVGEDTFYNWLKRHELFRMCYMFGKMLARENWEDEGRRIRSLEVPMGTVSHEFEYWRMIGWSRFGVGKNSRIRLDLDPKGSPNDHYSQLLRQAAEGDFTAGEIKQLMEAVNVGLNAHQVFQLQGQIDELKSDLAKMSENRDVKNSFAAPGVT